MNSYDKVKDYKAKDNKLSTGAQIGCVILVAILFLFRFITKQGNIYPNLRYIDSTQIVDAPVLVQMEDFGYSQTNVHQATVREFQYQRKTGKEYALILYVFDDEDERRYSKEDASIRMSVYECSEVDCERWFKQLMVYGKNNEFQITSGCNQGCIHLDKNTINNIGKRMFELDMDVWKADQGYALYDPSLEKNFPNTIYLMSGDYILEFELPKMYAVHEQTIQLILNTFENAKSLLDENAVLFRFMMN